MRASLTRVLFLGSLVSGLAAAPAGTAQTVTPVPSAAPAGPATATPDNQGRLTGHVLCDDTRRPARGALVMVTELPAAAGPNTTAGPGGNMAVTHVRADGSYAVEHLAPGEYTAIAVFPGYLSPMAEMMGIDGQANDPASQRERLARYGTVTVRSGGATAFDITLHRGAAISGQVLYADGVPAAAVNLILEDASARTAPTGAANQEVVRALAQRMFSQQSMSTDDQGRFRLSGLKPGTYRLAAAEPLTLSADSNDAEGMGSVISMMGVPDVHSLHFYAGDTTHRNAAKTFDLRPGDEVTGVDITLPLDAFHEIHGKLAAADGRTINQGDITLTDSADDGLTFHAKVARDGTFALAQIPAGNYKLAAANARIAEPSPDGPPNLPERFRPLKPVAAFADGSLTVVIQDHDLDGIALSLAEIPLPKGEATTPAPIVGNTED
ncbi:MAG TPA: carboxypeptidase-like regulatory domain-containing protein [Acidobacteriaceae bacterium]|nr:carboxypeptidase-like regulatory domain-containing protein [Acidobacteriaceae bacterium]